MTARVRLQLLETAAVLDGSEPPSQWMTVHELQCLQAMTAPARRESFIAGHWQARQLAAQWLQLAPARIGLDIHPDGRPRLLVDAQPSSLHLSLSHGGGHLALALSELPVGVDVEIPRKPRDLLALAGFSFSSEEVAQLRACDAQARGALFHHYWALKEARGKRSGEGLLPAQARRFSARPAIAASAEGCSWRVGEGALALCVAAGTRIDVDAQLPEPPRFWQFVTEAASG
ncbi:MAG: 4'-phosphopantetheinyl transferase superfamily protein [Xanthomonadaceae bacterium]|nr:4'-phosphopantetheinyl transferase superfamily protein [Xanthomonadaceae bacterium]